MPTPLLRGLRPPLSGRIALLRALVLFAVLAAALDRPQPAAAHARLLAADPQSGAALGAPPPVVRLRFSEAIDPAFVGATLFAGDETAVASGPPVVVAPETVEVPLPPDLAPGSYLLVWRVRSAVDGHTTTGTVAFSTGTGVAPAAGGVDAGSRPPWWRIAVRWVELLALLLVAGGFVAALLAGAARRDGVGPAPLRPARLLFAGAFGALAFGLLLAAYDLGLAATGASPADPPPWSVYRDLLLDSFTGRALLLRALLFPAALVAARLLLRGRAGARRWALVGVGLAAAMLLTHSAAGHARTVPNDRLAIAIDWAHLLAVALWLGPLPYLWLGLRTPGGVDARAAIERFSRLALGAMAVIVATGLLRASEHVAGGRSLREEDYGRVLLAKHLLFVPILIAAAVNRFVTLPRLRAGSPAAAPALGRALAVETLLGALVVVAAAALTELPPADAPLPVAVAARPLTVDQTLAAGDLAVGLGALLTGDPDDRFTITIADATGAPPPTSSA